MALKISKFSVKLLPLPGWNTFVWNDMTYHVAGHGQYFKNIANVIKTTAATAGNQSIIEDWLRQEKTVFSYIIVAPNFLFCCVDRIKSYPLFYAIDHNKKLYVSNCPYTAKNQAQLTAIDHDAMLGFSMTSYTLNHQTLYQSLFQLQAGEYLLYRRGSTSLTTHRYYRYWPKPDKTAARSTLVQELAHVMDNAIDRVIQQANGRMICLPLSGGLDSRILLTKLVEKKYDPLLAISYGLKGNFESKMAKWVAKKLQVKWQFIPAQPKQAAQRYQTQERFHYARFIAGLHTVPTYLEYETLSNLKKNHRIPPDSVIVNGQTGDFISGGHLPRLLLEKTDPNFNDFIEAIIQKHGALWTQLLTQKNKEILQSQIIHSFPNIKDHPYSKETFLTHYESWEWQERQCKAVIKGQRLYDFFHYDWALPLWDPELMDFWAKVPFEWKANQNLYIEYLQTYYPKLFRTIRPIAKPWVTPFQWIPIIGKLYGLCLGNAKKSDFYKRMYYYGTDYNQYALIKRDYYLKHYKNTHGFGPFLTSLTLHELGILQDSPIADTTPL